MDTSTANARPPPSTTAVATDSNSAYYAGMVPQVTGDSTFIINPGTSAAAQDGATPRASQQAQQQRLPVSASEFNHMFTPLSIERMFQRNPSMTDSGDTRASIMGMLWHGDGDDASLEGGAGDTLKLLLSHGSNPTDPASGPVTCASPPDTVTSQGSGHDDQQGYAQYVPPARTEGVRRLPPIPSSPHLRSASRMSLASSSGAGQRRTALNEHYARDGIPQTLRIHDTAAWGLSAPAGDGRGSNRPLTMYDAGDYGGQPLQVHSAVGPRHQAADLSLRHEVLDKVARKSQPTTPFDMHIPIPSSHRPQSMMPRPGSSNNTPEYHVAMHSADDITMLPGDNRLRAYWSPAAATHDDQAQASHHPPSHQGSPRMAPPRGITRPMSVSKFGSMRRSVDHPPPTQTRKASDGNAQLLTPKDFNMPLPERVGDMVLDKAAGEWVHISEYTPMRPGSPAISQAAVAEQRGLSSSRSSISLHTSPFPQPLPTAARRPPPAASYGMGLISPVENQRKIVREMSERRSAESPAHRRPIEDDALGSIVQRLVTPATSPEAYTTLDLSRSGIRSLAGLAQITSRLEAICLAGNKLQGLHGLPPGLVSLRAPSNWIRFSAADPVRFSFARELPHLEEIDLSANEISDIAVFSGLRHLRTLELTRNRIHSLSGLRGCRRLAYLGLRDNIVTDFDLDAAEAPMLATLDVFNNRLRVVPASIADFTYLAKANFVKNDLEKVEVHGSPAESLRELRLSENPLLVRKSGGVIDMTLWKTKFPGLKTLYLDICNIRQLAQSTGEGVWPSVFNLSLRGNALQPSLALDFSCLSHLKNLYAPDTQMVLPRVLPSLNNLLQLVLCNAGLTQLPSNMGAALPQLRLLDISNNLELVDLTPVLQLSSSLEVLKCRAIGFGLLSTTPHDTGNLTPVTPAIAKWTSDGVETFPDQNAANGPQPAEECAVLRRMAGLRRLKRLDFRFNRCTIELYAPPPATMSASALDSVLSPQIPSTSVMGDSGLPNVSPISGVGASAGRFDEESWIRQDQAHLASLKLTRQSRLIQRRENYWNLAAALFPRLEELDGIK
ncbi:Leucine-rich repeat protein, partial [Coemansia sp. S2]